MVTIGDFRKKLDEDFMALFPPCVALTEDLKENKDTVLGLLRQYHETVVELNNVVQTHNALRVGNVLNAVIEGSDLVSEEGKGLLLNLRKVLQKEGVTPEAVRDVLNRIKQKHEAMLKFLEREGKVEVR